MILLFSSIKKKTPFPPCVACNVVKILRRGANKNCDILRLGIRALFGDSGYQSPGILGVCGMNGGIAGGRGNRPMVAAT